MSDMDITFTCSKCGQKLMVDDWATGSQVQCPKCGQNLTVPTPTRPTVQPLTPRVPPAPPVAARAFPQVSSATSGSQAKLPIPPVLQQTPGDGTKQCPFCAETIKVEARICRFCGSDLVTTQPARKPEPVEQGMSISDVARLKVKPLHVVLAILVVIIAVGLYSFAEKGRKELEDVGLGGNFVRCVIVGFGFEDLSDKKIEKTEDFMKRLKRQENNK